MYTQYRIANTAFAWVAELVYAADSKSAGRKALRVRVSPQAHKKYGELFSVFFSMYFNIFT